ncbi:MAG: PD-(D/E)XK nuclease family protein [Pseudomonadota bacterium]|jgi:hypothetical protein|nr:PD-(D/E)XK nuclease family protein [Alphaproteobacteria bacterium]
MKNSFLATIQLIRAAVPSANLYNLWQIAHEINSKEIMDLNISGIIHQLQNELPTFQYSVTPEPPQQIQFSTFFSLQKHILNFFKQGYIIVCDDITVWEPLLKCTIPSHISATIDWICKLYKYTAQPSRIHIAEVLRHRFLQQDEELYRLGMEWEYNLRKDSQPSHKPERFSHPLSNNLFKMSCEKNFYDQFLEIVEKLPHTLQEQITPLLNYIQLLDDSPFCLEWFKKALYLKEGSAQVRLGLHEALKFEPNQVIFCLKHNQIKPKISQPLLKNTSYEALSDQLLKWKKQQILNIFCYSVDTLFFHPLVQPERLQKHQEQRHLQKEERPIANSPLTSRPTTVSASGFNLLMQDPYGFYARYILKLHPLERLTTQSFAKEFGLATHTMIEIYLKEGITTATTYADKLKLSKPNILWKSKMLRILTWVKDQITDLKPKEIYSEYDTKETLGSITLRARLDTLLCLDSGNLVVNFKTGTPPSKTDVINGYAPQLAIEIFLAQKSRKNIQTQAEFWQLKGTQPSGSVSASIALPMNTLQTSLEKIIFHYFMTKSPFLTCPWPSKTPKCNEYKILERSV